MRQAIYILIAIFGLLSCNTATKEKGIGNNAADTLHAASAKRSQADISIKGNFQYDQAFIEGLAGYNEPIKLIDNYIIAGKDTSISLRTCL